ncbi:MAG TPA: hypothetical protein VMR86_17310 [Myxococcota bacterium]|nr:hypothetical protein [Myxococcota bacterium]
MGEDLGPLFAAKPHFHLLWALGIAATAAAFGFALFALVRGRVSGEVGLFGLVAMPAFALLIANLVMLDRTQEVVFCGSCHEPMAPVVASMKQANDSLASIHYQSGAIKGDTACYTCHSGYGLLGDFSAKRAGLRHMWHELWGSYQYPLAMNEPFDIDSCLECHMQSPKFRAVPFHTDPETQKALVSREMSCTGACHPSAHPAEALNGSRK